MTDIRLRRIVITSMFAAITCVSTMVIRIPSPMNGYINLGDCAVLLSAWIMGPFYGTVAGGIGSMLADVLSGYLHYAPGTLIIKAFMGLIAYEIYKIIGKATKNDIVTKAVAGIAGELFMVCGYFLYAFLLLGKGIAAAASIPGNIVQGVAGVVAAVLIYEALARVININRKV